MDQQPKPEISMMTEQQLKESIHQAPGMLTLYANHGRIAPSYFDVRIFFGQLNITALGEQSIQENLCLILSPECAKLVGDGIIKALDQYQTLFGPLRTPPVPTSVQLPAEPKGGKKKVRSNKPRE